MSLSPPLRLRSRTFPAALAVSLVLGLLVIPVALSGQMSWSVSAWGQSGGTGNLFDGVALGVVHQSSAPTVFQGVSVDLRGPKARPHRSRYRAALSCWTVWDPWIGAWPMCYPAWGWGPPGWARPYGTVVWFPQPVYRTPGWAFSIRFGWHAHHFYASQPWVVHRPVVIQQVSPARVIRTGGRVRSATAFKEDPRQPEPRRAIRREGVGGSGSATSVAPAPPPDFRTAPSGRPASGVSSRPASTERSQPVPTTRGQAEGTTRGQTTPQARRSPGTSARSQPSPSTGRQPMPTSRSRPAPSTRSQPAPGARGQPAPSTRSQPAPTTRGQPAPTTRSQPAPSTRGQPAPTTRGQPAPSTRGQPAPTTRGQPAPRTRSQPAPRTAPSAGTRSAAPSRSPARSPSPRGGRGGL